jgi:hypothetical protein
MRPRAKTTKTTSCYSSNKARQSWRRTLLQAGAPDDWSLGDPLEPATLML